MAITAGGVGSGLDVNGIVSQLMALERRPANLLAAKGREFETQLSAYGRLRSALSTFETAMDGLGSLDKFRVFSASSSDSEVLTASANSAAAAGIYNIDVTRLAQNHKLGSDAITSTDEFTGTLSMTVNGETLNINTAGLTLAGIRDAINNSNDNPGLTASIFNVSDTQQRLVLTADESGVDARISNLTDSTTNVTSGDALNLTIINRDNLGALITENDLDANFAIDSFAISSSSNSVSNVIDGISLNLKELGSSTLTLARDDSAIEGSINEFVSAYNNLFSTIDELSSGDLAGDSTLRSIQSAIRNVFNTPPTGLDGTFTALVQVGIQSDARTGQLSLDSEDLEFALSTDFQSVADLFANNDQGFAYRLAELADTLQDNNNVVDAREDGLRDRIDRVELDLLSWESRLEAKEIQLRAQFASLDSLIGSLQSTSAFLAQQLANL